MIELDEKAEYEKIDHHILLSLSIFMEIDEESEVGANESIFRPIKSVDDEKETLALWKSTKMQSTDRICIS